MIKLTDTRQGRMSTQGKHIMPDRFFWARYTTPEVNTYEGVWVLQYNTALFISEESLCSWDKASFQNMLFTEFSYISVELVIRDLPPEKEVTYDLGIDETEKF